MSEQIKELCLFMVCAQTLLYFQSGKKYEKICRMILELLVLAGIVGILLQVVQSLGFQKGAMTADGNAVAGMRRSMEEALTKQLLPEADEKDFLMGGDFQNLLEKRTLEEIKLRYNHFAKQYNMEIQSIKIQEETLQVFLKKAGKEEILSEEKTASETEENYNAGNPAKIVEIEKIEIGKIENGEGEESDKNNTRFEKGGDYVENEKKELEAFKRQFALVLAMEEEKLEVILVD